MHLAARLVSGGSSLGRIFAAERREFDFQALLSSPHARSEVSMRRWAIDGFECYQFDEPSGHTALEVLLIG